jgi:hypothetical protein
MVATEADLFRAVPGAAGLGAGQRSCVWGPRGRRLNLEVGRRMCGLGCFGAGSRGCGGARLQRDTGSFLHSKIYPSL